jgi:hypothetical protein
VGAAAIDFPADEIEQYIELLSSGHPAYTTRTDKERGKYKPGDVLSTPWGDSIRVEDVQSFDTLEEHPFLSSLTEEQKAQLTSPYDLVKFVRQAVQDIDVSDLVETYRQFPGGHGPEHAHSARDRARMLAEKHAPEHADLAGLAALLHDIGYVGGPEGHEGRGAEMILADPRFRQLGDLKLQLLAEAIREHRASTGQPTSIVAKIVSDADRLSGGTTPGALRRIYEFGKSKEPELTEREQVARTLQYLGEKYRVGGRGRRAYFPETEKMLGEIYSPLVEMAERNDVEGAMKLLQEKSAGLEHAIGKWYRRLGSVSGPGAPALFRHIGGPLTGALVQGALLGGLGYMGGRHLLAPRHTGLDPHKVGIATAILGGLMGPALNVLPLWWNARTRGLGGINRSLQDQPGTRLPFKRPYRRVASVPPYREEEEKPASFEKHGYLDRVYGSTPESVTGAFGPMPEPSYLTRRGFGAPTSYMRGQLMMDPNMRMEEKLKLLSIVDRANPSGTGLIDRGDIGRAALGAGIGYVGANLVGSILDTAFGGLPRNVQKGLSAAVIIAGALRNTGVI